MNATEWLDHLEGLGTRLSLRLVVDAPRGVLDGQTREALAEHKPALMVSLARRAEWGVLSCQRWGPAVGDPTPGIDRAASTGSPPPIVSGSDPYEAEERAAIQAEA